MAPIHIHSYPFISIQLGRHGVQPHDHRRQIVPPALRHTQLRAE